MGVPGGVRHSLRTTSTPILLLKLINFLFFFFFFLKIVDGEWFGHFPWAWRAVQILPDDPEEVREDQQEDCRGFPGHAAQSEPCARLQA